MATPLIYPTLTNAVQKTLDASLLTGVTASATLNNVTGIQNLKGLMVIDRVDGNNNLTPNKREYVSFAGTSGSTVVTLTRGLAGSTDQDHAVGAIVEFVNDVVQQQAIIDGLLQVLDTDGALDTTKVAAASSVPSKATATENVTGTDDAKYLTALSNVPAFNNSLSRQAIINGNFDVWQRGTSFTLLDAVATVFSADRWFEYHADDGGTLPTLTRSQQAITPGSLYDSFYCSRLAFNGAGTSLGNSAQSLMTQKIEFGTRSLAGNGKKVTVSFWAKSDVANKKLGITLYQSYGTGGSPSAVENIVGETWTLTSTWTKYTKTFTTNTLTGKTFGTANNDNLELYFQYMWGSNNAARIGTTGAESYVGAGYVDIAQVQLCAGDVALPFMPKSFEEELRACQRYYEKSYLYANYAGVTNTASGYVQQYALATTPAAGRYGYVSYKVPKRTAAVPVIYPYSTAANSGRVSDTAGTDLAANSGNVVTQSENGFSPWNNSGGNITTGGAILFHWAVDAEL